MYQNVGSSWWIIFQTRTERSVSQIGSAAGSNDRDPSVSHVTNAALVVSLLVCRQSWTSPLNLHVSDLFSCRFPDGSSQSRVEFKLLLEQTIQPYFYFFYSKRVSWLHAVLNECAPVSIMIRSEFPHVGFGSKRSSHCFIMKGGRMLLLWVLFYFYL